VIVAVPYDAVVTNKTEIEKVARYNEITSEPYVKRIRKSKTFVGTQEVDYAKGGPQNILKDLGLYSYTNPVTDDYSYVGIIMGEVDRDDPSIELNVNFESACNTLRQKLASIGVENIKPRIVLGLECC
jgi:hypothetical protein